MEINKANLCILRIINKGSSLIKKSCIETTEAARYKKVVIMIGRSKLLETGICGIFK